MVQYVVVSLQRVEAAVRNQLVQHVDIAEGGEADELGGTRVAHLVEGIGDTGATEHVLEAGEDDVLHALLERVAHRERDVPEVVKTQTDLR